MTDSILDSIKKLLSLDPSYTAFDQDIILYTNGVFSTLNQLGIGPDDGFSISDNTVTWDAFLGTDKNLNNVKSYIVTCVRLQFDPPATSFVKEALETLKQELEWRMSIKREVDQWIDPTPSTRRHLSERF